MRLSEVVMSKYRAILFFLVLSLFLTACSVSGGEREIQNPSDVIGQQIPVEGSGQYVNIAPAELKTMLDAKDFYFVNVHVPYEGEIDGTDAQIPFDEVQERLADYPEDKDAKIVVYCRSGSMSGVSARALIELGYTNVYNLDGGFQSWAVEGFDLIQ